MLSKTQLLTIALLVLSVANHSDDDRDDEGLERCVDRCLVSAPNPQDNPNASDFNGTLYDNTTEGDQFYSIEEREKCKQQCEEAREKARGITVAFAVIIIVSVVLCITCAIVRYACHERISEWKERRKHKPVANNLTPDQFASYADEFQNIFTEGEREMWEFTFMANGVLQAMQWFSLEMKRVSDYEYSIKIKGQDVFGVWEAEGFYVNTVQGPIAWWFKNYEQFTHEAKYQCVYELIRSQMGSYTGVWSLQGVQELANLQKRFGGPTNVREEEIQYDIQSAGASDEVL